MSHEHHNHSHEHRGCCREEEKELERKEKELERNQCCKQQHVLQDLECDDECDEDEGEDFALELLELADDVWMDVLREKLRKHIEVRSGARLDRLAQVVAEANATLWRQAIIEENAFANFREAVTEILGVDGHE